MNNSIFNLIIAKTYVQTANFMHHGERKFAKCASFHFTDCFDCITTDEIESIYCDLRLFIILIFKVFSLCKQNSFSYTIQKKDKKY